MNGDKLRRRIESISVPSNNPVVLNGKYSVAGNAVRTARYSHRDIQTAASPHLESIVRQRPGEFSISLSVALKTSL